jgi:hypothetical protein
MEKEYFFSGYCRVLDSSRMVEIIAENGKVTEVDCCFGNCVYQSNCPIAKEIEKL